MFSVHSADYDRINEKLAQINWDEMKESVGDDPDGTRFLTKIQNTVLDAVIEYASPKTGHRQKATLGPPNKTKHPRIVRERRRLKQKRRKIRARIRAVEAPTHQSSLN